VNVSDPQFCLTAISGSICAALAMLELILKYPHAISARILVFNSAAFVYFSFNFIVGCAVYLAATSPDLHSYMPAFLVDSSWTSDILRASIVGFVATSVLRASIFSVKVGETDVPIGPAAVLQGLQQYLDRRIRNTHKEAADKKISEIMNGFDALSGKSDLVALCLDGLNSCSKQELDEFRSSTDAAVRIPVTLERVRAIELGKVIYLACGLDVLKSCVDEIRDEFRLDDKGKSRSQVSNQLAEERRRLLEEGK